MKPITMDLPPTVLRPSKTNSKMLPPSYYAVGMKPTTMDLPPTVLRPSKINSKMLPPSYYAGGMKPTTMDLPPTVLKPSKTNSKMLPPAYYIQGSVTEDVDQAVPSIDTMEIEVSDELESIDMIVLEEIALDEVVAEE